MQIISNDKIVRSNTVDDLKEFNSQSLPTQTKKGEQKVSMVPAIKKAFALLGDDLVELSTEKETLKNQIGDYNEKWLEVSKAKLLNHMNDDKRVNLIRSRMQKQMKKKTSNKWLIFQIKIYVRV